MASYMGGQPSLFGRAAAADGLRAHARCSGLRPATTWAGVASLGA